MCAPQVLAAGPNPKVVQCLAHRWSKIADLVEDGPQHGVVRQPVQLLLKPRQAGSAAGADVHLAERHAVVVVVSPHVRHCIAVIVAVLRGEEVVERLGHVRRVAVRGHGRCPRIVMSPSGVCGGTAGIRHATDRATPRQVCKGG